MHIYVSGIGGVAIGPLALICRDAGIEVSGSDQQANRLTDALKKQGISFAIGQDGMHIAAIHQKNPIDWLVVSSAIPHDHPEMQFARTHNIKISKRDELIIFLLHKLDLKMVAVSGTHGKTTTTAMLVWLFKQFGMPISYSVGSSFSFGAIGAYQPGSGYFVYEADEYDRNMLSFKPFLSLITTVDYDHPDTYPTKTKYNEAFEQFIRQSERVITWAPIAERLGVEHECTQVVHPDDSEIASIKLPGQHNRQNAWLAATGFNELFAHKPMSEILARLAHFPGTERRFERLAKNIYTDYAHHPAEIRATLQLAGELSNQVVVVYQPHQNIRQHTIAKQYKDCFANATRVYWLPTYLTREDTSLETLPPPQLISQLSNPAVAQPATMDQHLLHMLRQHVQDGALVLFMGAGDIDEWARDHLDALR